MTFQFNTSLGTILVGGLLTGPAGSTAVALILDTGASRTTIREEPLTLVGYDPSSLKISHSMLTANGVIHGAEVSLLGLDTLGMNRLNYPILAFNMPGPDDLDGVLGLDFFRDQVLTLDFQKGEITLNPGTTP